ncbi:MAG: DNA repair protein RadC [Candidatus Nanosalina sp.]
MDYTIKDLPESERPREKLEDHGASQLTDVELLSIVLRTGTQGKNVKELASEILNTYSLDQLGNREMGELKRFEGISRVKAGQLQAVGELSRRMKKEEREKVSSLSDVRAMCQDMKFLEEEILRVLYLSSGNELLSKEEFSGGVSQVGAEPRKIFKEALNSNAAAIILLHNHPSGEAEATEQDLETTRELVDLGDKLGVEVLDHIIAGEEVFSMRESSKISF